jgi:hypothetical protein
MIQVDIARDNDVLRLTIKRSDSPETTRAFVAALKSRIPQQYRRYDPQTFTWTLRPKVKYDVRQYYRDPSLLDMRRMVAVLRELGDDYDCRNILQFAEEFTF